MPGTAPPPVSAEQERTLQETGGFCSKFCLAIPLGTWWGVNVRLSGLYIVVWGLLGWFADYYTSWEWAFLWAVLSVLVVGGSILVHEFGHAIATNVLGGRATEIMLWPLGGVTLLDHNGGPRIDLLISVAGPLTHIPQAVFWLVQALIASGIGNCSGQSWIARNCAADFWDLFWYRVSAMGVAINIVMLVGNLIPMYPLDGGRALLDAFLSCGMTPRMAAIFSVALSMPMAVATAVLVVVYLKDWVTFSLALLLLIPNLFMVYLIVKRQLHVHPSFRNLKISRDEMDVPILSNDTNPSTDAEMSPVRL
ncbi:hypothetical protein BSKO_00972 [Bryopsis sp. KO-2023]|nr:hypothetical protein BSKO_00972 [Bryopsis sp. KO-2023]